MLVGQKDREDRGKGIEGRRWKGSGEWGVRE